MPRFLDLFINEIRIKGALIKSLFSSSDVIKSIYYNYLNRYWNNLPRVPEFHFNAFAIDSSDAIIEHKTGVVLLISRALGLSNNGKRLRKLRVEVLPPVYNSELSSIRSLLREHLEHIIGIKAIDELSGTDNIKVILLDGSLFGRMMHVPKGFNISYLDDFILDYINTYYTLLDKARRNSIILVGVSKSSRARILREMLLDMIFRDIIRKYISDLDLQERIIKLWDQFPKYNYEVLDKLSKLVRSADLPDNIMKVFFEIYIERSDFQILMNCIDSTGFTQPLELSYPSPNLDSLFIAIKNNNLENYVINNFRKSFIHRDKEEFIDRAMLTLAKILEYPAIISFYLILSRNDIPMRIDIPAYCFGLDDKLGDLKRNAFISVNSQKLNVILSILIRLYSSPKHYNALLESVDKEVKFKLKNINIYERILSKELGVIIEHTRDMRRVKYP